MGGEESEESLAKLSEKLRGQKYGFLELDEEDDPYVQDVLQWLEMEMST